MSEETKQKPVNGKLTKRVGSVLTLLGLTIFLLGADPEFFGMDRSPVIGFVQVIVFSFGLVILTLGGSISLNSLWPPGQRSILADIGLRLVWTGLVVAIAAGMADLFGLGTRPLTESLTYFGYWQARGVLFGEIIILIGFILMIPFRLPSPPKNN